MRDTGQYVSADALVVPLGLDVTDDSLVARAARECVDVQILVNNARVGIFQPFTSAPDLAGAQIEMRVNYFGTLAMCRAFAPVLAQNGGGAIINVLSILARVPTPVAGSYSASKAAALSLTQSLRGELARQNTLVIGVMPGFVDTDMVRHMEVPKLDRSAVAASIIHSLRDGVEDVYPGPAAQVAEALVKDAKGVERQFAAFVP